MSTERLGGKSQFIRLVENNITSNEFERVKQIFRDDVNSVRRFEGIKDVAALLDVLEDRQALTEDNLTALNTIIANVPGLADKGIEAKTYFDVRTTKTQTLPEVLSLIPDKFQENWRELGENLGLDINVLQNNCSNITDILLVFMDECKNVSLEEMKFRLDRAIQKCDKLIWNLPVVYN